ncbi:MAG: hypothetical protein HND53_13830 [Proteobacteria bacterium]|nr:hypothetical protein [Pseudomonadota bacterium]
MKAIAYMLLFGFLFQPLIVFWSTPSFYVNSETGLAEVTCALKGDVTNNLHTNSIPTEKLAREKYCPAVKLVEMADLTLRFAVPVYQARTLYLIGLVNQTTEHQQHTSHYNTYSTRAPPQFS